MQFLQNTITKFVLVNLALLQEASVWLSRKTKDQQQRQEIMTVRLALVRSVARAHLTVF